MSVFSFFDASNILLHIPIGKDGYELSWIEAIGTFTGFLCVWYASKEQRVNFIYGLVSAILFVIIFYQFQLYAMVLLQVFFLLAYIYGWFAWSRLTPSKEDLKVSWLSWQRLLICAVLTGWAIGLMTFYIDPVFLAFAQLTVNVLHVFGAAIDTFSIEPEAFPFLGSCVAILSIVAQMLMTRKYIEAWILWAVVNIISTGIYFAQGLYFVAVQYCIFFGFAIWGIVQWSKMIKNQATFELKSAA